MVYLDGRYLPLAEAKVSVLDRGFLFGDGIYEVIPVYSRRPFRLAEHLARLDASLAGIRMANPHSAAEWAELIAGLVAQHATDDQSIYLQVTRGPMAARRHVFPATMQPTVFMMSEPLSTPPAQHPCSPIACCGNWRSTLVAWRRYCFATASSPKEPPRAFSSSVAAVSWRRRNRT
jgi:D-alanine transaminase